MHAVYIFMQTMQTLFFIRKLFILSLEITLFTYGSIQFRSFIFNTNTSYDISSVGWLPKVDKSRESYK